MANKRNIIVVTGSRAEFGLLAPVMRAIVADRRLRLQVVAAGSHWVTGTWRDVRAAGFEITARVTMQQRGKLGRAADVAAVGRGVTGFGKVFSELHPDVVLVLGDRIEAFAAATAASIGGVRIAHVHGGDRAQGVADEAMRHAISKLAHLHFAATAQSRKRLVRMGEAPGRVFNVGSPAADGLREVVAAAEGVELIVAQHPIGASDRQEKRWMKATLDATAGYRRLILAPNLDAGSGGIGQAIEALSRKRQGDVVAAHLGRGRFLALLKGARAIVGNSSAGLIEAAVLGVACVNIGPRQAGRERAGNVVDCDYGVEPVRAALARALDGAKRRGRHPYGDGRAGQRIAQVLAALDLAMVPVRKHNAF